MADMWRVWFNDPSGMALNDISLPPNLSALPWQDGGFFLSVEWGYPTYLYGTLEVPEPSVLSLSVLMALGALVRRSTFATHRLQHHQPQRDKRKADGGRFGNRDRAGN